MARAGDFSDDPTMEEDLVPIFYVEQETHFKKHQMQKENKLLTFGVSLKYFIWI